MVFPGDDWAVGTPASQGVIEAGLSAALGYLGAALDDHGGIGTVFIVRNGYVVHTGPASDKEHQIYSATKSFVSTVLGLLIQDGKVSLETSAAKLEPALAEHYSGVTLRHFATMTSGYDSVGGSYEFDAQGRGDSWNPGPPAPPIFPPGTKFRYWDDAMSQFGNVLTKAAGQPLDQVFKSRVADPIGMTRWRWTQHDTPTGRILSYGFNWWVNGIKPDGQRLWPGAPPRTYYANGLHNNVCIVVPEWNLVLARTNGGRKDGSANTPAKVDEIWSGFFGRLASAIGGPRAARP